MAALSWLSAAPPAGDPRNPVRIRPRSDNGGSWFPSAFFDVCRPGSPGAGGKPVGAGKPAAKPGAKVRAIGAGRPGHPDPATGASGAAAGRDRAGSGSAGSGGDGAQHKRHGAAAVAHNVAKVLGAAAQVVTKNADKSVFPFSLVMIVFLFLGIQGRIDRSDPKLALAPLTADPDLEFSPPPTEA